MLRRRRSEAENELFRRLDALEAATAAHAAALAEHQRDLARAIELLEDLRRATGDGRRFARLTRRAHHALDALLRRAYLDESTLEYPFRLTAQRFRLLSQNAEDGIALAVFKAAGVAAGRFAELGCGHNGGNSGFFAQELGWSGLMVDADPAAVAECRLRFSPERIRVVESHVTRENVDRLLTDGGASGELDLLSIDIDGNDIWVFEAVSAASPRVAIVEYNALFGADRSVAVPYDPEFRLDPGMPYFGASLTAVARTAARKGYRLVATEPRGANAFFLREDVAPAIPACTPGQVFSPLLTPGLVFERSLAEHEARQLLAREEELDALVNERALPLVEVE